MPVMHEIKFKEAHATLPASDINRAKRWYSETLGLQPVYEGETDAVYEIGGSRLYMFQSMSAGTNQATAVTLAVDDAGRTAQELHRAGVELEKFDIPGAEWEEGIARSPSERAAATRGGWFRDSEGNIIGFGEFRYS